MVCESALDVFDRFTLKHSHHPSRFAPSPPTPPDYRIFLKYFSQGSGRPDKEDDRSGRPCCAPRGYPLRHHSNTGKGDEIHPVGALISCRKPISIVGSYTTQRSTGDNWVRPNMRFQSNGLNRVKMREVVHPLLAGSTNW